ncbi:prolyl oligopeptidase family protein [Actinotalea sp. JY-7885]|uniref:prolyl oligopeptidase family serine peptidase n=1 Tax=Actinotalea sp. JY-7885 TaxID=2758576 RepID=UPI00165D8A99|nr:prolyl oligopeptidase family serine peptidase [Actinotalea sp. JY-7885]
MTLGPYPPAERSDVVDDLHGRRVPDPYRWLEDADADDTRAWSAAQDALLARYWTGDGDADRTPADVARWRARLAELMATGSTGTPVWRGESHFRSWRAGDAEHAVVQLVGPDGRARTLVDPVALDPAGTTTLDAWQPSIEGDLLAYQVSSGGTEESVLHVLDVATGELVDGPIDRARYSPVAWLPGGEAFFYVRRLEPALVPAGEEQYHRRVWLHRVGTDPATDVEVFGAGLDRTTYFGVSVTRDGRWLLVSASAGTAPRTDVWIADLDASAPPTPDLRPVVVGRDAETSAWVGRDGRLYLHTDLDAPRGRLAVTDPSRPGPEHWRTLLAEDPEAVLQGVVLLDDGDGDEAACRPTELVALWTRHSVSELTVHDPLDGAALPGPRGRVPLPGLGTVAGLRRRPTGGRELWFGWTDTTTPTAIHRWDARTGEVTGWASPPGTLPHLPEVRARQVTFPSADGTPVRMLVVARADLLDDAGLPRGPLPTILYGYGGFQISLDPAYSATALAWVEAGGAYVVANLRGGGEEGEQWHRTGMRGHKQNVFDDAHAAAERLVADGWTTPDRLAVWGGSNGGLLVGAFVTQRPDLAAAAVCSAPLLDMVRYQHFGLGVTWTEEYGDAAVPQELDWLLGYSPYHRAVAAGERAGAGPAYPAVLFTVFEGDTRVDPLHARKTCAALQHATSASPAGAPVLLRRETGVGHGGRSLSRTLGLTSEQLAFVARQTGLDAARVGAVAATAGAN